ncbi:hypothetical protein [Brevibacillus daliensis]|uniref:hypothetical protein n=1 Tax=Brevibacillus daliensis TaxID=2892995 RepID=UPI001E2F5159|nr:hypothetical protein [Brevibacillus daliensis]
MEQARLKKAKRIRLGINVAVFIVLVIIYRIMDVVLAGSNYTANQLLGILIVCGSVYLFFMRKDTVKGMPAIVQELYQYEKEQQEQRPHLQEKNKRRKYATLFILLLIGINTFFSRSSVPFSEINGRQYDLIFTIVAAVGYVLLLLLGKLREKLERDHPDHPGMVILFTLLCGVMAALILTVSGLAIMRFII